jgi:hypothetical protein
MIRRGEPWGYETMMPDDVVNTDSDASLGRTEAGHLIFISGGDVARSIGNPSRPQAGDPCTEVAIDAMKCTIYSEDFAPVLMNAASSIVIGNFWRGRHVIVSNAGWLKDANIAPRSHPNDGVVEMTTLSSEMSLRQRILAHRKMRTGTHVPHPDIVISREKSVQLDRERTERLVIDGVQMRHWTKIVIEVVPDYWRVLL